ncbi:flagellar export chaperone FliS [Anaerobacillus isosaccharinicus]|uniref:Flagellar secretion chaperone FliS n=1 Tax=Anaerobacillus isosaccharinicus TaxID=1532552 RepID=A0A1S2L9M6_9BACI|nr:flagellar export chaperone FliS [Anaerobacillus isosaccharinicus]MBA5584614.1 flagellar export chaperone FliS [Anaerobacillus isosaccharinicus]QOY38494.1 flagellar export chaperone FliS [Anaerobacillus isosaccharinicus]
MQTANQAYQKSKFETASPGELTLMLYNGCLKFMKLSKEAISNNQIELRNLNLTKAQNIIRELMVTLKTDGEVGKNMLKMYDYILHQLTQANINNDIKAIEEAEQYVTQFRDTWKEVIMINRKRQHGGGQA